MSQRDRISNEKIIAALDSALGIISVAAKKLRVHRNTLSEWIKNDAELREAQISARSAFVDLAESKLVANIRSGKETSIIFALNTQGRDRGYGQRIVVSDASKIDDALENASNDELLTMLDDIKKRVGNAT